MIEYDKKMKKFENPTKVEFIQKEKQIEEFYKNLPLKMQVLQF